MKTRSQTVPKPLKTVRLPPNKPSPRLPPPARKKEPLVGGLRRPKNSKSPPPPSSTSYENKNVSERDGTSKASMISYDFKVHPNSVISSGVCSTAHGLIGFDARRMAFLLVSSGFHLRWILRDQQCRYHLRSARRALLLGLRFCPSDEEPVVHYLLRRALDSPLPAAAPRTPS
ncbi:hypothetical protein GUJ93_ZPchr0007g6130 [Zizania palustris]|uniref:NAC domain-containing protein n=1 Tax=Zizania palustris TaxID=103762 RepID=A0A8J5THH2_ZIZPA|nr:hypothetical protein GUJ93_ZPchr0007g6130 [Zizania palustris]